MADVSEYGSLGPERLRPATSSEQHSNLFNRVAIIFQGKQHLFHFDQHYN